MPEFPPVKGATYTARFPIYDINGNFLTGAGATARVSTAGAAFGASSNAVVENGADGIYSLVLTAGEMNGYQVEVRIVSTGKPVYFLIHTQDVISELAQAIPSATPLFSQALMLLYMIARNQFTNTSADEKIRNDAGTVICKAVLSDDGTTFTRDKLASGP